MLPFSPRLEEELRLRKKGKEGQEVAACFCLKTIDALHFSDGEDALDL
jgi:hypothetical protein